MGGLMEKKLTPKQEAFVREYMLDLNASAAAERAGYSEKTAGAIGHENLNKPEIQKAINAAKQKRAKRAELSADWVLRRLRSIADSDLAECYDEAGNLLPISEIPKRVRKTFASVETFHEWAPGVDGEKLLGSTKKIKINDKLKALEMIGRHLKMFTDTIEIKESGLAARLAKARKRMGK